MKAPGRLAPLHVAIIAPPWFTVPPSGYGGVENVCADLVTGLAVAFTPLAGVNATAVAIVAVTVVVRLLLSPLTWLQIRAEVIRSSPVKRWATRTSRTAS